MDSRLFDSKNRYFKPRYYISIKYFSSQHNPRFWHYINYSEPLFHAALAWTNVQNWSLKQFWQGMLEKLIKILKMGLQT